MTYDWITAGGALIDEFGLAEASGRRGEKTRVGARSVRARVWFSTPGGFHVRRRHPSWNVGWLLFSGMRSSRRPLCPAGGRCRLARGCGRFEWDD